MKRFRIWKLLLSVLLAGLLLVGAVIGGRAAPGAPGWFVWSTRPHERPSEPATSTEPESETTKSEPGSEPAEGGGGHHREPTPEEQFENLFPSDPIWIAPPDPNPPPVTHETPSPEDYARDPETGVTYVQGSVMVYFTREASEAQKKAAVASVNGEVVGQADLMGKWEVRISAQRLEEIEAVCAALQAMPGVSGAMPDLVLSLAPQGFSSDPWVGAGVSGSAESNRSWAEIISLPEAWEYKEVPGSALGVAKIGELDTGIQIAHPELSGRVEMTTSVNNITGKTHGTGVAGVMAAAHDNAVGLAGVAWNAKIYATDVYGSSTGVAASTVYAALAELVRVGGTADPVRAINFSSGEITSGTDLKDSEVKKHAETAARELWQLISFGYTKFVIVQSAGNHRKDAILNGEFASVTPSNTGLTSAQATMVCNRILVVGALEKTSSGLRQYVNSATGSQVSLYAPGVNVFTTSTGNAYLSGTGTSFAAPMVAATAALMGTFDPSVDGGQIGQILKSDMISPREVQDYASTGVYPRLDVRRALDAMVKAQELVSTKYVADDTELLLKQVPAKTPLKQLGFACQATGGALCFRDGTNLVPLEGFEGGQFAATGQELVVKSPIGYEKTYVIAVSGDLTGDGRVHAKDAQQARLGRPTGMSEALFLAAGDVNSDGVVNDADAEWMFAAGF